MKAASQAANQQMKTALVTVGCIIVVGLIVLAAVTYLLKDSSREAPVQGNTGDDFDDD
jgi:hypothetical protein